MRTILKHVVFSGAAALAALLAVSSQSPTQVFAQMRLNGAGGHIPGAPVSTLDLAKKWSKLVLLPRYAS